MPECTSVDDVQQERGPDGELKPYCCQVALHRAVYDPYSKAVYFVEGRALMRLGPDNVVSPLAGHREQCGTTDGPGPGARFQLPQTLVCDGTGNLAARGSGVSAAAATVVAAATLGAGFRTCGGEEVKRLREILGDEKIAVGGKMAIVRADWYTGPGSFVDVAYDIINRRLYAATIHAVFHIPEDGRAPIRIAGSERPRTGTGSGFGSPQAAGPPGFAHSASNSGSSSSSSGSGPLATAAAAAAATAAAAAGAAAAATGGGGGATAAGGFFTCISGIVADLDGGLLIADRHQVFRLEAAGGSFEAVICLGKSDTSWGGVGAYPVIMPGQGGWLALCQYHHKRVLLLQLGLRYSRALFGGGTVQLPYGRSYPWQLHHEGVAGLVGDLASLLAFPGGSEDVEVAVGGRSFLCHRLILAARCLYFRRLFAGGFADSGARQVVLQDADADAFELLLRYMYTGDMGFPPHMLRPVAELADRLLLSQVVHHVHRRLLAAAQPGSVVDDMLWAHQHGFEDLLVVLKEWYLSHQAEVLAAAGDSVRQLVVAAPSLMYDLHCATVRQVGRRR
ncbi:hypothetical protein VOLCADRAFT_91019 [Volvox carteri f. nagariensis]|uniref:BTB domain-containing protein n=1 Tax=Volvox carteri f. nagariensis TaxID=3068 RepID=D8TVZ0_VOLCA|nr:uncharacterized protein VOLCADRAFT_91019 [Volvox carteri f. nagariensis]EFJ48277.1 hypothetical protein VOLCADRAFT_91019 [Volvox carteri f. nagariensis]|eukprot:XP_002950531.1 hypothetical protein VOLCADRAFT_91019 [Volvox carteri f. nagariensis]